MQRSSHLKPVFRVSLLVGLMLMFAMQFTSVGAADPAAYISVSFGNENFGTTTIGRSFPLYIDVSAGADPISNASLKCYQNGTSLSASSISQLPNSGAFLGLHTQQYYRAVAAGTTSVYCVLKGTDVATGTPFTVTSNTESIDVSGEKRLYASAYSATKTATVGQAIFLTVIYGNRGKNTLTNVQVSCTQLGRGIGFISSRQTQTTLPSGQSGFAEYRLQGVFHGASGFFLCTVTATDSSTNETITLKTHGVAITIV